MRVCLLISLLLFFCELATGGVLCLGQDAIEVDLNERQIRFVDFSLGGYKINGSFSFVLNRENGSLILDLKGKNIVFKDKNNQS